VENTQVEETATDSDQEEDTINEKEADDKDRDIDEDDNRKTKTFEHIVKTINKLPDEHYVWGYPDPTNTYYMQEQGNHKVETENDDNQQRRDFIHWYDSQLHTMAEFKAIQMLMGQYDELTAEMGGHEQEAPATPRDEAKPATEAEYAKQEHVKIKLTTEDTKTESIDQLNTGDNKTQPLDEAASTKEEAEGSSSVEPEWARFAKQNEKEIEKDYHTWKTVNVGGYTSQRTTQSYRHGRCYMCSKPVSTTNLDPEVELFCQECGKDLTELDCGFDDNINTKRGMERRDRDDEEEWGRIPIPQSDDSDNEPWFEGSSSPESEQEEEDTMIQPSAMGKEKELSQNALMIVNKLKLVNKEYMEDFAFRNGHRRDGAIRKKDGSILTIDDQLNPKGTQPERACKKKEGLPEEGTTTPRWSPLLLAIQHLNLRMGYNSRTKVKVKLMRDIRKHVPRKEPIRWEPNTSRSRHINLRFHSWTTSDEPIYRPGTKETKDKTNSVTAARLKVLTSVSHHLNRWDITQIGIHTANLP
jgi:hypothetical protein